MDEQREFLTEGLLVRDAEKREIEARIVPFETVIQTSAGREMFSRGAFTDTQPSDVILRMSHQDPPAGRGLALEERADGAYMTFRVSKTAKGDEILELARDGVTKGVSVGFQEMDGGTEYRTVDGRRTAVYTRALLREVSTTWMPAYPQAQVLAVREKEETEVAEGTAVSTPDPSAELRTFTDQMKGLLESRDNKAAELQEKVLDRLEKIEERNRSAIIVPGESQAPRVPQFYSWLEAKLKQRAGDALSRQDLEKRDLADVLLADQYVPASVYPEIVGYVNTRRPFLSTTNQVAAPEGTAAISIPVVTDKPTADVQANEKDEVESNGLKIENALVEMVTIAGAVDVSYQFIRRGPRTYFDLLRRALFAAYAATAEAEAITALLNGISYGTGPTTVTPTIGTVATINPEDLVIGDAWTNSMDVIGEPPDTMWASPDAVEAFINAKADTTNAPLYSTITSQITVGSVRGSVSGLRFVPTPALAGSGAEVIIGPSSQFAWAEDGTFELQVDNPSILGRDIALASFMFFMPLAPAAFTYFSAVA